MIKRGGKEIVKTPVKMLQNSKKIEVYAPNWCHSEQ
jgi:hypothetical protein